MAFMHCPFRELAEAYPELVCNLHRGISEGIVGEVGGGTVEEFATLYDRDPCRVAVVGRITLTVNYRLWRSAMIVLTDTATTKVTRAPRGRGPA